MGQLGSSKYFAVLNNTWIFVFDIMSLCTFSEVMVLVIDIFKGLLHILGKCFLKTIS